MSYGSPSINQVLQQIGDTHSTYFSPFALFHSNVSIYYWIVLFPFCFIQLHTMYMLHTCCAALQTPARPFNSTATHYTWEYCSHTSIIIIRTNYIPNQHETTRILPIICITISLHRYNILLCCKVIYGYMFIFILIVYLLLYHYYH